MDLWCGFHTFRIRECQVRFPEMCVTWSRCVVNIINSACICLQFRSFCNFDATSTKEKQQPIISDLFKASFGLPHRSFGSAAEAIFRVSGLSLLSLPVICNILAKRMLRKSSNKCVRWKCPESMICSQTSHLAHAINGEWPHELSEAWGSQRRLWAEIKKTEAFCVLIWIYFTYCFVRSVRARVR